GRSCRFAAAPRSVPMVMQVDIEALRRNGELLRRIAAAQVALKRSSKGWCGRCPFHDDSSPSFNVYDGGGFHCYGCGADGSIFDFVMKRDGVDFAAALRIVADAAGVGYRPKQRQQHSVGFEVKWTAQAQRRGGSRRLAAGSPTTSRRAGTES